MATITKRKTAAKRKVRTAVNGVKAGKPTAKGYSKKALEDMFKFLLRVQKSLSLRDFSMFPMPDHQWKQFTVNCKSNLLDFTNHLDDKNEAKFYAFLLKRHKEAGK